MDIMLYYAPLTCSLVPFVTLTEANANFKVHPLDHRKGDRFSPEYLKINPNHKVPALMVDGRPLTENVAINVWIAEAFPEAKLLPDDPWQRVKAISILSWCATGMHPHISRANTPSKYCDGDTAAESVRKYAAEFVCENFSVADAMLAGRDYFFDHFTATDAYFFWCFRRSSQLGLDLSAFPNCTAHFERMLQRESVHKLAAFEAEVQAKFAAAA